MKCPKCQATLEMATYTGLPVSRCTDCQGLWIRAEAFGKLKRDDWLAGVIDEGSNSRGKEFDRLNAVHCPECGTRMKQLTDDNQPHILYEQCPKDGSVFFDAGELKDLAKETFWDKFKTKKILDD